MKLSIEENRSSTNNQEDYYAEIRVSEINENIKNIRDSYSEESIDELAESIKQVGQIEPIVVLHELYGYSVIAGFRRYRAIKKLGLSTIKVIVKHEQEARSLVNLQLAENLHREDLTDFEIAKTIQMIAEQNGFKKDSEIAKFINKPETWVKAKRLHYVFLKEVEDTGFNRKDRSLTNISTSIIKETSGLPTNIRVKLLDEYLSEGLTAKELREKANQAKTKVFKITDTEDGILYQGKASDSISAAKILQGLEIGKEEVEGKIEEEKAPIKTYKVKVEYFTIIDRKVEKREKEIEIPHKDFFDESDIESEVAYEVDELDLEKDYKVLIYKVYFFKEEKYKLEIENKYLENCNKPDSNGFYYINGKCINPIEYGRINEKTVLEYVINTKGKYIFSMDVDSKYGYQTNNEENQNMITSGMTVIANYLHNMKKSDKKAKEISVFIELAKKLINEKKFKCKIEKIPEDSSEADWLEYIDKYRERSINEIEEEYKKSGVSGLRSREANNLKKYLEECIKESEGEIKGYQSEIESEKKNISTFQKSIKELEKTGKKK